MGNTSAKSALDDEMTTVNSREAPPAHFMIKIESFSLFDNCGIEKYETNGFMAGGYKWRLIFYFNGKDVNHISVNLAMVDTSSLPANWEVNAVFTIFLYNQISGNYVSSAGRTKRFQATKSEWGISKLISKTVLCDPSKGYLINDNCVFGAEVFVVKREAKIERVSLKNVNCTYYYDLKIPDFSKLEKIWHSSEFSAGGQRWKIRVDPKGYGEGSGCYVSIFLCYLGSERVQACYTICMKNLVDHTQTRRYSTNHWFTASSSIWGWPRFIEIATICNAHNNGFIVKDCCYLNIDINVKAVARVSSLPITI